MLTLLLGTAGTGKTTSLLQAMKERAQQGKYSFFIVPEQMSAMVERMIYHFFGDELSGFVTSCSFRTLSEQILERYGEAQLPLMSDAGRAVLVRRAMDALDPQLLGKFSGQKRSAAFCAACADVIQEMKTAGVTPDLMRAAGKTQPRLAQLSYIYEGYEALLQNTALDPADRITVAAQKLQPDFWADADLFFDGFDGFTAPQYQLLRQIFAQGANITVALCCEGFSGNRELFLPAQKTAQNLNRMAKEQAVRTQLKLLEQDQRHQENSGMAQFTDALTKGEPLQQPMEGIWVTPTQNSWQQAKYAAAVLAEQARKGVPYSKMVVVCRDKQPYSAAIRWECALMQLPLFEDEATVLQFSPCADFLRAAVEIATRGMNATSVLELLKSGLVDAVSMQEVALLENYTQVWRMRAEDWFAPLPENHTLAGFEGRENDETAKKELQMAENARATVADALQSFYHDTASARTAKGMNGGQFCLRLYELMQQVQADEAVKKLALAAKEESETAQEDVHRMWEATMQMLDELYRLLKQEDVTATEFGELLNLMLRSIELGKIPQKLEQILFTTADRLQPQGIECCVLLGANEGEFPQFVGASGLLSHSDRDLLKAAGAELPGEFEQRVQQEQLYFYRAATAACCNTWIFYQDATAENRLASQLSEVMPTEGFPAYPFTAATLCPTPKATLDYLCGKGGEDIAPTLAPMQDTLRELQQKSDTPIFKVEDSTAMEQLLGVDLSISPSRMERFYRCKLAYFLEYVVRVKLPHAAKLDALLSGTMMHYILENALQDELFASESPSAPSTEQFAQLAQRLAKQYLEQLPQQKEQDPLTRREKNVVRRIVDSMVPLLEFLYDERKQSKFVTDAYEMQIGQEGKQSISVPLPNGHTAHITGKIDRVDKMQCKDHCWLRVVDYKSGSKDFSLDNVYYGIDTQMLLYLFSLCSPKAGGFSDEALPAGVLYFLVAPKKEKLSREDAYTPQKPRFELHGLVTDETEVHEGMDTQKTGRYVPFQYKKDGTPDARSARKRITRQQLLRICTHLQQKLQQMGTELYMGNIEADPLKDTAFAPCDYCEYGDICRRLPNAPIQEILPKMGEEYFRKESDEEEEENG